MLLFVLEKMASCIGIMLESIGLILSFCLEKYWKRIGLITVYIAFGSGIALARIGLVLFYIFLLKTYWKSIGLILFYIAFCIRLILEKSWFKIVLNSFCIGTVLEKYGFHIVFYFFLYWKSIGLTLFYVAFCVGTDSFLY